MNLKKDIRSLVQHIIDKAIESDLDAVDEYLRASVIDHEASNHEECVIVEGSDLKPTNKVRVTDHVWRYLFISACTADWETETNNCRCFWNSTINTANLEEK